MAKRNKGTPAIKAQKETNAPNEVFVPHPAVDVYYLTSDGSSFYLESAAQDHAKELNNKTIQKITKTNQ
ncbi:hypothetical protein HDF26_005227 [Pedobacter cryoconitis]|uniref:hypothetical protein n=1 Tax=Pedobacter cryoconitis TaxID=188932 RepID=UPI001607AC32|nr:hypothetical protein [Pedobacter cryoconitis]MBB6274745.1 hypothetical protein [Pedobacter cryoconitis]